MSTTKVAWGWGVSNAYAAARSGKLFVTANGASGAFWDVKIGYPAWGYTQNTVTENEKIVRAALTWLTGKSSGMNILIFSQSSTDSFGPIGFQDFVTRSDGNDVTFYTGTWSASVGLSSIITWTNASPGSVDWTLTDWFATGGGHWDPTQYDLVILPTVPTVAYHWDGIDAYLNWGGSILGIQNGTGTHWDRYGISCDGGFQSGGGAPDYMTPAFTCPPIGNSTYQYGIYSSSWISTGTNTMGGVSGTYPDGDATDRVGVWSQY